MTWREYNNMNTFLSTPIDRWPVDRLIPYARNARTHSEEQIEQIACSIREFGFTNPILVDTDAGILAGHARLLAARRVGLSEVPVILLDHLTETQKRAYILADNKLALNAGWDDELLAKELAALAADGLDRSLTGFSDEELAALLQHTPPDQDEDAVPSPPATAVSRPGDLWRLGPHRIWCVPLAPERSNFLCCPISLRLFSCRLASKASPARLARGGDSGSSFVRLIATRK